MTSQTLPTRGLADLEKRVNWEASPFETAPHQVTKARLKELHSIGHKLVGFLSARGRWWQQAAKATAVDRPVWVRGLSVGRPGELREEGLFACSLLADREGFKIQHLALPPPTAARLAELWQRIDLEAPKSLPPVAAVPSDVDAPLWFALLRLKPLREFWDGALRRATVDTLLGLLPDAWVLDPEPVPKGAVIPRLDLASWSELPECRIKGHSFVITRAQSWEEARVLEEDLPADAWSAFTKEALEAFAEEPRVLVDVATHSSTTEPLIVAFYESKAGRVEGLGAMALVPTTGGRLLPACVTVE